MNADPDERARSVENIAWEGMSADAFDVAGDAWEEAGARGTADHLRLYARVIRDVTAACGTAVRTRHELETVLQVRALCRKVALDRPMARGNRPMRSAAKLARRLDQKGLNFYKPVADRWLGEMLASTNLRSAEPQA